MTILSHALRIGRSLSVPRSGESRIHRIHFVRPPPRSSVPATKTVIVQRIVQAPQAVYDGRVRAYRLDPRNGDRIVLRGRILGEIGSEVLAECRVADEHVCA